MKSSDLQKLLEKISPQAQLVAVTKGHSIEECMPLYESGIKTFGENRVQDALPKMASGPKDISWHYIGTLQKNKVNKVVGKFDLIHSVDTFDLAEKISKTGPQNILLQVNIRHRNGFSPEDLREAYSDLLELPNLSIKGLMTMAPDTEDERVVRDTFRQLRRLRDELGLQELSMGMSQDWQIALDEGATLLRIGTKLFS